MGLSLNEVFFILYYEISKTNKLIWDKLDLVRLGLSESSSPTLTSSTWFQVESSRAEIWVEASFDSTYVHLYLKKWSFILPYFFPNLSIASQQPQYAPNKEWMTCSYWKNWPTEKIAWPYRQIRRNTHTHAHTYGGHNSLLEQKMNSSNFVLSVTTTISTVQTYSKKVIPFDTWFIFILRW